MREYKLNEYKQGYANVRVSGPALLELPFHLEALSNQAKKINPDLARRLKGLGNDLFKEFKNCQVIP